MSNATPAAGVEVITVFVNSGANRAQRAKEHIAMLKGIDTAAVARTKHHWFDETKLGDFDAYIKTLLGGTQGQVMLPASTASETRFTVMLGGSVDVGVNKWLAFRIEPGLFRTSFASENQNAFRISFGPVFRFGSLPEH